MNTYKVSFKTFIFRIFIFLIMIVCFGLFSNELKLIPLIALIILLFYLTSIFFKILVSITLDKNKQEVLLKYKRLFILTEIKKYHYDDIDFYMTDEIGARGSRQKVFNISLKGTKIERITSSSYFWSLNILEKIITDFKY